MDKNILYILGILEAIEKIKIYSSSHNDALSFFKSQDQLQFNASLTLLIAIAEECKKIDDDKKSEIKTIEWKNIIGMRNQLVHNYRGVNFNLVWDVIKNHLDPLKQACIKILQTTQFNTNELKQYLSSPHYEHLSYLRDVL